MAPLSETICGYAIVFDKLACIDGDAYEVFDRRAFDGVLAARAGQSVPVIFDSHEPWAPVLGSTAELFADDYGLGFSVTIDMAARNGNWQRLAAMHRRRAPVDQCSIFFDQESSRSDRVSGVACQRIVSAQLRHIAIVDRGAYGAATGAWVAGNVDESAPWRIREMAEKWALGFAGRARSRTVPSAVSSDRAIGRTIGGSTMMMKPSGSLYVLAAHLKAGARAR